MINYCIVSRNNIETHNCTRDFHNCMINDLFFSRLPSDSAGYIIIQMFVLIPHCGIANIYCENDNGEYFFIELKLNLTKFATKNVWIPLPRCNLSSKRFNWTLIVQVLSGYYTYIPNEYYNGG